MSDLLPVQRDLARLLFSLPEAAGYALAGGAALVVQQIVDRDTRDLDAFIAAAPGPTPGTVDLLADAFTEAAQRAGWTLQTIRRHPTFCRFILGRDDDTVELDLAVDSPLLEPPTAIDGIPVLTPLDLAARKVLAVVDRLEARDYTDLHALAQLVGQQTCIDSALTMDAGLSVSAIAEAFERIDRIAENRYPESATDAATTRRYFTTWAHELLDDH
jgi:hypothetical protein